MSQPTPAAAPPTTVINQGIPEPLQAESPIIPKQRYSIPRRIRANLYGRGTLILEATIALVILAGVPLTDVLVFRAQGASDPVRETLGLLTLQQPFNAGGPSGGPNNDALLIINVLFSLIFIQTILNTIRALVSKRPQETRQLGLASTCSNHVIVCGLGRMGLRVISRLVESGTQVVVIERDFTSEMVPRAMDMRVPVVPGEADDAKILRKAGITRACAVIACIDGDLADVEIALAARAERADIRVILRAFNEDFDRGLERSFGPHTAFSASALAAPTFAAATLTRDIEHVLPLGNELLGISEFKIAQKARISGTLQSVEDTYNVRVIYQVDSSGHQVAYNPKRPLASGEELTVLGQIRSLEALRGSGLITGAASAPVHFLPSEQHDRVIICGFGKVGYRVVNWLAQLNLSMTVIYLHDDDEHVMFAEQAAALPGIEFIRGDARKAAVLRQAGIDRALAVTAVTSDDLTNLQIGLEARRLRPDVHVVLRVFNEALAQKLPYLFGIHTAYSTSDLASSTLAAAAVIGGISHAFPGPRDLYALEERIVVRGDHLAGERVLALRRQQAHIIALRRVGAPGMLLPTADTILSPGDMVSIVAPLPSLVRLRG